MVHTRPTTLFLTVAFLLNAGPMDASLPGERHGGEVAGRPLAERAHTLARTARQVLGDDPAAALGHARNALLLAEQSGDAAAEHRALRALAEAEERLGLHTEFLRTTLRALQVAQVLDDHTAIAEGLQSLSAAYRYNLAMDKAVDEARNALGLVTPLKDQRAIDRAQRFLMATLVAAGRYDEALRCGEDVLRRLEERPHDATKAGIHLEIARVLLAQRKFGDALPFLAQAERILDSKGSPAERFALCIGRARAMAGMGRTKEAEVLLAEAERRLPGADERTNRPALLELRYEVAARTGQWERALRALEELKARADSSHREQVGMRMAGLQAMHELDRKERDNERLRDLNARNEETIAEQRAGSRGLFALAAILLALAAGLALTARHALRTMRRLKLKNELVQRQGEEIHAKNLELQRQNMRLAEALMGEEEKEMVIKEIHHRVKNNLQVVDSLLSLQGGERNDPETDRMFRDAQGRIRSMALVHEHIYRSGGTDNGSLREHLAKLGRNVLAAYGMHDRVSLTVDAVEPGFTVDTMMPLTLVVNELLTNAVKHAFQGRDTGHIRITVRNAGEGYELLFADDGNGLGQGSPFLGERSFGLELVRMLAHQLNGQVDVLKGAGATFSMTFSPDAKVLRKAS